MNYKEIKRTAQTGDVILHEGDSLGSRLLRVATASNYSHVGLLRFEEGGTLWLCEMKPDTGYTKSPASARIAALRKTGTVRYGDAPAIIDRIEVQQALTYFRDGSPDRRKDPNYSLIGAVIVWLAQWALPLVPKKWQWLSTLLQEYAKRQFVCSTFVQHIWEAGGLKFTKPADPEDIADRLITIHKITD